ncbi:MAG: hypothetical protein JWN39_1355, partial [Ilumatobacteraceae bacterium]|nr:hypothetical protein [Ilumatobacteraceae bacterium]
GVVTTAAAVVAEVALGATATASVVDVAVVDVAVVAVAGVDVAGDVGGVVVDATVSVGCGAAVVVLAEADPDPPLPHAVASAVRPSRPNTARRVMASSNQPMWFALTRSSSIAASPSSEPVAIVMRDPTSILPGEA